MEWQDRQRRDEDAQRSFEHVCRRRKAFELAAATLDNPNPDALRDLWEAADEEASR